MWLGGVYAESMRMPKQILGSSDLQLREATVERRARPRPPPGRLGGATPYTRSNRAPTRAGPRAAPAIDAGDAAR